MHARMRGCGLWKLLLFKEDNGMVNGKMLVVAESEWL